MTVFTHLKPRAPPGRKWVTGRLTKTQLTSRPGHLWPETWREMSKKQKKFEIEKWEALQPKLKKARGKRGVNEIPEAEATELLKIVSNLRTKLSVPVVPAMPLVQSIFSIQFGR